MADSKDDFSDKATNMELLEKAKNEFNREKRLIIKNLPSATSEKDIHAFMGFNGEFPVESVAMVKNLNQAIVTLKDPSLVDDAISKLDNTKLDTLTVSVAVYRSEKILCVAHLPLTMTEYKFREMVVQHGTVDTCFLMRSEHTGCSKGYGFVEYNEPIERVGQIKCAMDWLELDGQIVHCDAIVDSSQSGIDFQDLHSKCLLINNLPDDYCDSITLRELFSQLVKPIYCQIVTKEGCSLGFGIIEYDDASDAEKAFNKFNGYEIHGKNMNIQYCIPGKSAVHMFNRIMYQYGDKVNVNKSSLLPDPVYPNPAFLKHIFFKTHVVKHPRLLVQFTENLLYLQEGYVKRLENRTNAKPGLLGPPPTIPMSPLMDINLQLGLLSVIVLDLREKGKYNGEVPEPLGKVKIPSEEEFQEKPQPVSLLGDPMTAQANIILKNILMPEDGREQRPSPTDENTPRLLGKPVSDLSMVYLCSFGRLMSMLTEKSMNMGILGNAPNNSSNAPVKPLMEGLMQAGKVAQKLLNTMNMGQQNNMSNMMNQKQTGLLGNPQNMNNNNNNNTGNVASNFMNTIQQMAMQKLGQNQNSGGRNKQELPSLFGNNNNMGNNSNNNTNNTGDGLLGNYQGPAMPGRMQGSGPSPPGSGMSAGSGLGAATGSLGGGPKPLMSLNFNNKGDGLIPTPPILEDDGSCGFSGNHSNYDDSGYQGGFDDAEYNEAYGDTQYNGGKGTCYQGRQMNNNKSAMGRGSGIRSLMDPDFDVSTNSEQRYDGAYFSGINGRQKTGMGATSMGQQNMGQPNMGPSNMGQPNVNRMGDNGGNKYNNMAQQAAFYAAGAAAAYKHQYEEWMQSSGYNNNQSGGGYGTSNNQSAQTAGYGGSNNQSTGYGASNTGFNNQQMGSFNNQGQSSMKNTQMSNSNMNQQQQQFNFSQNNNQQQQQFNFSQNTQKSGSVGGYGRDGKSSFGTIGQRPPSLMGPPNSTSLNWQSGATGLTTPQGQKRAFSHVLPSPEPSPEGDYIGQHSQGLGGHYADTYTKRQKLSGRF